MNGPKNFEKSHYLNVQQIFFHNKALLTWTGIKSMNVTSDG
ncbi:MAG: hypothetical protein E7F48_10080 [Streptococcus oralis]|nr:hypothetical protein [Streptococcus oralis]